MRYRPEIDGMRAIAVAPVILFHAGIEQFAGGFAGVDVFFVISGYLITGIIYGELARGEFSVLRFYERRARRILPALAVVVATCLPFAWAWMLPAQFEEFSESLVAVTLFVSNLLFWSQSNYFGQAAETIPLLHTWSLAVEEQYYIIFPVAFVLLWRLGWRRLGLCLIFAAVSVASLALCEWGWRAAPIANFYMFPMRAWELFVGSILAIYTHDRPLRHNNVLSLVGLGLIIAGFTTLGKSTPYPSLWTLAPVGGAALVIAFAGRGTWTGWLLSAKPLVGLGLISYSAYLWHQPLFAFARLRATAETENMLAMAEPGQSLMLGLAVLSIVLAWLTWRFVEQPFRRSTRPFLATPTSFFTASAAVAALILAVGVAGHRANGNLMRYPSERIAAWKSVKARFPPRTKCSLRLKEVNVAPCIVGDPEGRERLVGIGDSHVGQWVDALDQIGKQQGWRIEIYAKDSCPVADVTFLYRHLGRQYFECYQWRDRVLDAVTSNPPERFFLTASSKWYVMHSGAYGVRPSDWHAGLVANFKRLARTGASVFWLLDNPRAPLHPPQCYFRAFINSRTDDVCGFPRSRSIDPQIQALERDAAMHVPGTRVIDFTDRHCGPVLCGETHPGQPPMRDNNHLTTFATKALTPLLARHLTVELAAQGAQPTTKQIAGPGRN